MRHSDKQTDFATGAKRDTDEGKGRPSLISPVLIHRLGVHLAKGAKHYGDDNWAKGMPYRRTADSMIRHIFQWLAGDEEEDHLAAVAFGVMCLMTYEASDELDTLDDRLLVLKEILPSILTSAPKDAKIEHNGPVDLCKRCGMGTVQEDRVCLDCKEEKAEARSTYESR